MARSAQSDIFKTLSAIGDDGLLVAKSDAARMREWREQKNGWKRASERKDWLCDESAPHVTAMGGGFGASVNGSCRCYKRLLYDPPYPFPPL